MALGGPAGVSVASGKSPQSADQVTAKPGTKAHKEGTSPSGVRRMAGADFCVSGGAPLVGDPIVDRAGAIHFLTADSYLHSFEADGRFRSSYTLDRAPSSGLLERDDGVLLAITTGGRLYGLESSGALRFERPLGVVPASGLVALGQGRSGFLAQSGEFLSLGAWGEIIYRVRVRGQISGDPVLVAGQVWLARGSELLALEAAWRQHVVPFRAPIQRLFAARDGEPAYALVAETLYQIHHHGGIPRDFEAVSDGVLQVTVRDGTVAYVRAASSAGYELVVSRKSHELAEAIVTRRVSRAAPSGAPLVAGNRAFFPFRDEVWEVGPSSVERRVFRTDPGSALFGRGALLMSVHRGNLVCVQRLQPAKPSAR